MDEEQLSGLEGGSRVESGRKKREGVTRVTSFFLPDRGQNFRGVSLQQIFFFPPSPAQGGSFTDDVATSSLLNKPKPRSSDPPRRVGHR